MQIVGNDEEKENIFGTRLKNLRSVVMKKTQKEFSELLGIPQPTLSSYESGRNKPTIDVVISIAEKCDISVDWLCGRDHYGQMNSLSDVLNFFFELYETREFSCTTEIYDRVDIEEANEPDLMKRNWIRLMFFYNEFRIKPENIYSQSICSIIQKASELYDGLVHYEYPQEYYESEKQKWLEYYKDYPLTKTDLSGISEEERRKKHLEVMMEEMEKIKREQNPE